MLPNMTQVIKLRAIKTRALFVPPRVPKTALRPPPARPDICSQEPPLSDREAWQGANADGRYTFRTRSPECPLPFPGLLPQLRRQLIRRGLAGGRGPHLAPAHLPGIPGCNAAEDDALSARSDSISHP